MRDPKAVRAQQAAAAAEELRDADEEEEEDEEDDELEEDMEEVRGGRRRCGEPCAGESHAQCTQLRHTQDGEDEELAAMDDTKDPKVRHTAAVVVLQTRRRPQSGQAECQPPDGCTLPSPS